jgi:hypothetical protein
MAKGSPAMPKALIVGALAVLVNACSLLSGEIKESNELGEWVVAKPQTFMYKSYSLNETESLPALTRIVAKSRSIMGNVFGEKFGVVMTGHMERAERKLLSLLNILNRALEIMSTGGGMT